MEHNKVNFIVDERECKTFTFKDIGIGKAFYISAGRFEGLYIKAYSIIQINGYHDCAVNFGRYGGDIITLPPEIEVHRVQASVKAIFLD